MLYKPILALNCRLQIEQVNSDCAESDYGSPFFTLPFSFTDSLCFKLGGIFVDEATPLCSILSILFPGLSWNIEILKRGFKGGFVAFLLATLLALFFLQFSIENFLWQPLIRHFCDMASPS